MSQVQPMSDALTRAFQRGEHSALEVIVRQYGPAVAEGLRRRYVILNEQDIEDILAIALYELWKYRKRYDPAKGALDAVLFRIADHTVRDVFRHGWHKAKRLEMPIAKDRLSARAPVDPPEEDTQTSSEFPEDLQKTADLKKLDDLRQVIDKLPPPYRHIVLADAYARGRVASSELLSQELEIPPGTVRVYRNRAKAAIRREMQKRGYHIP